MRRIHIVGRKNSGKTTLVTDLVAEFTRHGLRVGTIKHTHHQHELDTPGKDSHRHREAGAAAVGILSRSLSAVFWPSQEITPRQSDQRYERFAPLFSDCDLVLVEGDTHTSGCKIEVWRAAVDTPPLAESVSGIHAIITDDDPQADLPTWSRSDLATLAKKLMALQSAD